MLDLDLSDPVNQVRATIGDIDIEFISNSNIDYLLKDSDNSVLEASRKALDYILAQVGYYVKEQAGGVLLDWRDLYNQLDARKKKLDRDALYRGVGKLFIFGGTSKIEMDRVKSHPDYISPGYTEREFTLQLESWGIDPENPYLMS